MVAQLSSIFSHLGGRRDLFVTYLQVGQRAQQEVHNHLIIHRLHGVRTLNNTAPEMYVHNLEDNNNLFNILDIQAARYRQRWG